MSEKAKGVIFFVLFIAIFIICIIVITPIKYCFEYGYDEGINLMKSFSLLNGFSLYKQIWSDQPPLFTVIIAYWLKLFSLSVYHARILVAVFSAIFLWGFYQIIKAQLGRFSAFMAASLLFLSMAYVRLSISVMIGIPALALAMLSIYFISIYKKSYSVYSLIFSGIFMALSLQVKLFTAILLPLIILELIRSRKLDLKETIQKNKLFFMLFTWLAAFLALYISITVIFFYPDFNIFIQQLFQVHLVKSSFNQPQHSFLFLMPSMLLQDFDIVLLALAGIALVVRHKKWQFLFPVLWLILAFFVLINHRPVWEHHYLLLSPPCCWLAAISLSHVLSEWGSVKRNVMDKFLYSLTVVSVTLALFMFPLKYDRMKRSIWTPAAVDERKIIELITKYGKGRRWIVTDRPIFAFYGGIPVPPELAVLTEKRMLTKNLTPEYFISILEKYRPGQILLARFENYAPEIISYIDKNYVKIYGTTLSGYWRNPPYRWIEDGNWFHGFHSLSFFITGRVYLTYKIKTALYILRGVGNN